MGVKDDTTALAEKLKRVFEERKSSGYNLTAIWYKFAPSGNSWLYFAKNWTEALAKAKTMSKPRKKKPKN